MYLSKNDILQLNTIEIYNLVKMDLDNFYSSYNNIFDKYEYKEIVLDEIENLKQELENSVQNDEISVSVKSILLNRVNKRIKIEIAIREKPEYQGFVDALKKHKVLPQEEINELTIKAQNGDSEARDRIVNHNLKLVVLTAKKYIGLGLEIDDLIQEGIIGLITAVNKFDVNRGTKFSTYAVFHIKNSIYHALHNTSRNIRLPEHQYKNVNKFRSAIIKLSKELNREPTFDEIADEMNISYDKALQIYNFILDTVSIYTKINSSDDDELELGDVIASDVETDDKVIVDIMKEDLEKALSNPRITERERYVIINRFGLFGNNRKTLDSLGKKLNITRERVRQIEKKGIVKLKNSNNGRNLEYYVNESRDNNTNDYGEQKDIFDQLPKNIFNYLIECRLTRIEILTVSLSLGLINMNPLSPKEIISMTDKSSNYVYRSIKNGLEKLSKGSGDNKEKFNEYLSQIEENVRNKDKKTELEMYDLIGCTKEEFERVYHKLSESEKEIINKRMKNNYKIIMKKKEQSTFEKSLRKKIENFLLEDKKEKARQKELNLIHEQINSFNENVDKELVHVLNKAYDTKLFKELNKIIPIKESIAILLIEGYIYDSYYPIDYVSKLLNISSESIYSAEKKADNIIRNISNVEKTKVKELLKK